MKDIKIKNTKREKMTKMEKQIILIKIRRCRKKY